MVERALAWFAGLRPVWQGIALASAPVLLLHAGALALLELHVAVGGSDAFDWGHVSVAGLWGAAAAAALVGGARFRRIELEVGGLAGLALALGATVAQELPDEPRAYASLVLGAAFLAAGTAHRLLDPRSALAALAYVPLAVSAVVVGQAVEILLEDTAQGAAYVAAGALYGLLAGFAYPRDEQRDTATLLGALGLVLAGLGSVELLDGNWLVLPWAVAVTALAWAGSRLAERRLQVAAAVLTAIAGGYVLTWLAPPTDLLVENGKPAAGAPAVALVVAALAALGSLARPFPTPARDGLDRSVDELQARGRRTAFWLVGVLAVHAASLGVLGAFQISDAGVATDFQRGHTAVSALWGLIGLVLLYVGLKRGAQSLRLGGFVLFGVSLAKIFLYDLSALSSVARALSFLAVGAVLLVGGFLYQRLSSRPEVSTGS